MAKNISSSAFFRDVLGAELRNQQWSWGAYDPVKGRLFLRVWDDEMIRIGESFWVMVLRDAVQLSRGRQERQAHLDLIPTGVEVYGVLCTPVEPRNPHRNRRIRRYDSETLLRLGEVADFPEGKYARIVDHVPVDEVMRASSGAATLRSDLLAIQKQKGITRTEREALTAARIGQGAFRNAVLVHWGGTCAVTGCNTLEVIRASHIKPWRLSTDVERLDPENGLPLVATLDALFDAGLISFADDGGVLISRRLPSAERASLGLMGAKLRARLTPKTAAYLAEHRGRTGLASSAS